MTSFISGILYSFKRNTEFHTQATITRKTLGALNYDTGARTVSESSCIIARAFFFTKNHARKFSYDLSFIAANKNFTYGGTYDKNMTVLLVEGVDLTFEPEIEDIVEVQSINYRVKDISKINNGEAYILRLEAV